MCVCVCVCGIGRWPRGFRRLPESAGRTFFFLLFFNLPSYPASHNGVSGSRDPTSCRLPRTRRLRHRLPTTPARRLVVRPSSSKHPFAIQHNSDPELYIIRYYIYVVRENRQLQQRRDGANRVYCRRRPTITLRFSRSWFLHRVYTASYNIIIIHFALYRGSSNSSSSSSSSCGYRHRRRRILDSSETARGQTATAAAAKGCAYYYYYNVNALTQNSLVFI